VAVQVTVLAPSGKVVPEAGVQVTGRSPSTASVADGAVYVTPAPLASTAEAETSPNYQRLLDRGEARDVGDLCAAGDEGAILARFKQFADAGVTDLSVRLLPIGDNREELIASKYRTREVIADLAKAVR